MNMKMTEEQKSRFAELGEALVEISRWAEKKKDAYAPLKQFVTVEHRDEFLGEGVTIGKYKFRVVPGDKMDADEI